MKYSPNDGGLKYFDVAVLYIEGCILCRSPHTKYIFPTALNPIFKFLKKIHKFKVVYNISEYPFHRYADLFHSIWSFVKLFPLDGAC